MMRGITFALLALASSGAGAQTIATTCDNLVQNFNSAPAGATLHLVGSCGPTLLRNREAPLTIVAGTTPMAGGFGRAEVRGLSITNVHNLTWVGGVLKAQGGMAPATAVEGYGVHIRRGRNIEFREVRVTDAVRGIVINNSNDIRVRHAQFDGLRSDGVNFVDSDGFLMEHSRFRDFRPRLSRCTYPDGSVVETLSQGKCTNSGGSWKDGDHPDVFQTWTNSANIMIRNNDLFMPFPGWSQGITTAGSKSVRTMQVLDNRVVVDLGHAITVSKCTDGCLIRGNYVSKASDKAPFAVGIHMNGGTTIACGNIVTDPKRPLGTEPC